MLLLLSGLWPGMLAALALGLGCGRFAAPPGRRTLGTLAFAAFGLAGLAAAGPVTGPAGLWLESAAAMLLPYLAGCALGALARRFARVRPNDPPLA